MEGHGYSHRLKLSSVAPLQDHVATVQFDLLTPPPTTLPHCVASETGGLLAANAPMVGASFTVTVVAKFPSSRARGYIFARSDESGARYFGLYKRSTVGSFYFYYRVVGADATQQKVKFSSVVAFTGGEKHTVRLEVSSAPAQVVLRVNGAVVGVKSLLGPVADCGAASSSCLTHVGQRHKGYGLRGMCVSEAILTIGANEDTAAETLVDTYSLLRDSFCIQGPNGGQLVEDARTASIAVAKKLATIPDALARPEEDSGEASEEEDETGEEDDGGFYVESDDGEEEGPEEEEWPEEDLPESSVC